MNAVTSPRSTDADDSQSLTPFLKWPGGKRWFAANYAYLLPRRFRRYFEPFLGGGALYFHLRPTKAVLSDINPELIATYVALRHSSTALIRLLNGHQRKHGVKYYYKVRDELPRTTATKAARMIYLNRTCFNGIYRVNLRGEFNVPKGTKEAVVLDTDNFREMAQLLAKAQLYVADFEDAIAEAGTDDFIFADPPYTVRHNLNGFVKYNEQLFSWEDQIRLAMVLAAARDRGATIIATNANHQSVRELYKAGGFSVTTVLRYSSISADASSRRQFDEIVIRSC